MRYVATTNLPINTPVGRGYWRQDVRAWEIGSSGTFWGYTVREMVEGSVYVGGIQRSGTLYHVTTPTLTFGGTVVAAMKTDTQLVILGAQSGSGASGGGGALYHFLAQGGETYVTVPQYTSTRVYANRDPLRRKTPETEATNMWDYEEVDNVTLLFNRILAPGEPIDVYWW